MNASDFRAWRAALGWSQRRAALELQISHQMVKLYERGRDYSRVDAHGEPRAIVIPRVVELACYFLLKQSDRGPFAPIGDELAKRRR